MAIGAVCSGSTLFASILNSSVMLGNHLQQTTSADNIFRCFFLGALRVKSKGVCALRGFFGPLWSQNLKVAFSAISSYWSIRRIAQV